MDIRYCAYKAPHAPNECPERPDVQALTLDTEEISVMPPDRVPPSAVRGWEVSMTYAAGEEYIEANIYETKAGGLIRIP